MPDQISGIGLCVCNYRYISRIARLHAYAYVKIKYSHLPQDTSGPGRVVRSNNIPIEHYVDGAIAAQHALYDGFFAYTPRPEITQMTIHNSSKTVIPEIYVVGINAEGATDITNISLCNNVACCDNNPLLNGISNVTVMFEGHTRLLLFINWVITSIEVNANDAILNSIHLP